MLQQAISRTEFIIVVVVVCLQLYMISCVQHQRRTQCIKISQNSNAVYYYYYTDALFFVIRTKNVC